MSRDRMRGQHRPDTGHHTGDNNTTRQAARNSTGRNTDPTGGKTDPTCSRNPRHRCSQNPRLHRNATQHATRNKTIQHENNIETHTVYNTVHHLPQTTLHANRVTPGPNTTTQDDACTGRTLRDATRKRKQKTSPQPARTNTMAPQGSTRTRRPHEPEEACARENATREVQQATQGETRHTVTPTGPNRRAATPITNREASTNPQRHTGTRTSNPRHQCSQNPRLYRNATQHATRNKTTQHGNNIENPHGIQHGTSLAMDNIPRPTRRLHRTQHGRLQDNTVHITRYNSTSATTRINPISTVSVTGTGRTPSRARIKNP